MARCYLWLFSLCINIKKVKIVVRLAGDHLCGKLLFTWLSLVMSMTVSFCAVLFPTRYLGWDLDLNWVSFWGFSYLLFLTHQWPNIGNKPLIRSIMSQRWGLDRNNVLRPAWRFPNPAMNQHTRIRLWWGRDKDSTETSYCDTWRALGCKTKSVKNWSKRKPPIEPRMTKQQSTPRLVPNNLIGLDSCFKSSLFSSFLIQFSH